MPTPQAPISFARTSDGQRLAYSRCGHGPTLIQAAAWMGHLEHADDSPMAGALVRGLARQHSVVRYDQRGCGLSDLCAASPGLEGWVRELETVADATTLGLTSGRTGALTGTSPTPRIALLGISQGAAIAIAYAVRHPERVSRLVLHGGYARGRLVLHGGYARGRLVRDPSREAADEANTLARMAEIGWGRADEAFRQVFTTQIIPAGTHQQQRRFNEMQRHAASPDVAAGLLRAFDRLDVSALLPLVRCPTLVLHSRDDPRVPFDEGRYLAAALPDAEFVSIASANHLLLEDEPAWPRWLEHVQEFLAADATECNRAQVWSLLTHRQRGLTELMAQGLDNGQIAASLGLSGKTVRNHITAIFGKLSVENRSQAIVRLRDSGFGAVRHC